MSKSDSVRYSRGGDQFHYLWAARRCLRLLSPTSGLVAISIEGASKKESATGESQEAGEELIDVGEYYGSEAVETATLIRYIQLKHSTQHADEPWPPSGLKKLCEGLLRDTNESSQRVRGLAKPPIFLAPDARGRFAYSVDIFARLRCMIVWAPLMRRRYSSIFALIP